MHSRRENLYSLRNEATKLDTACSSFLYGHSVVGLPFLPSHRRIGVPIPKQNSFSSPVPPRPTCVFNSLLSLALLLHQLAFNHHANIQFCIVCDIRIQFMLATTTTSIIITKKMPVSYFHIWVPLLRTVWPVSAIMFAFITLLHLLLHLLLLLLLLITVIVIIIIIHLGKISTKGCLRWLPEWHMPNEPVRSNCEELKNINKIISQDIISSDDIWFLR